MRRLDTLLFLDLVGSPYVADARGPAAFDCLGLAIEMQRRLGRTVPEFVSREEELHRQLAEGGFLAGCSRLERAEAGCVALFKMPRLDRERGMHHLGTMLDPFRMLHTSAQTGGAVIESILGPLWQLRCMGFYRLQGTGNREQGRAGE